MTTSDWQVDLTYRREFGHGVRALAHYIFTGWYWSVYVGTSLDAVASGTSKTLDGALGAASTEGLELAASRALLIPDPDQPEDFDAVELAGVTRSPDVDW